MSDHSEVTSVAGGVFLQLRLDLSRAWQAVAEVRGEGFDELRDVARHADRLGQVAQGVLGLRFRDDPRLEDCKPGSPSWQEYDKSAQLDWASFSMDRRIIAELPNSPRFNP